MKTHFSLEVKNNHGKAMPVILLVVAIIAVVLYLKTDLFDQAINYFSGSQNQQVTYYQWTDERGEMIVSRNKPTTTDDYISFQSSKDLMKDENIVDQNLINKNHNQQSNSSQQNQQKKTNGKGAVSSMYPFNSMSKAKNCVNLSSQIADAKNRGQDTSELKKKHAKECR